MFDVDLAVRRWKRAFAVRTWYTRTDVRELEHHLRDVIRELRAEGLSPGEAFRAAVDRVGDEPRLRAQFHIRWQEQGWLRRYVRTVLAEANTMEGAASWAYGGLRVVSLVQGLYAALMVFALGHFLMSGVPFWTVDAPLLQQGLVFVTVLALGLPFNLTPFQPWRGAITDWLRLGYSAVVFWLVTLFLWSIHLVPLSPILVAGVIGVYSGPVLWLVQMLGRRAEFRRVYSGARR